MITLEANYSKKIGLPNYSSHQFSVSLKTEFTDVSQVELESARLYSVLQQSVDNNIQQIGYAGNKASAWRLCDLSWPAKHPGKAIFLKEFKKQLATSQYYKAIKQLNL